MIIVERGVPQISIVMPVWNGARYIREAIDSVLAQTYRDFELIVVDDGSEDETPAIIRQYGEADVRVNPIYALHRGMVPALNEGCEAARGKYVARLDYDDVALPERLDRQFRFMETHPGVAVLGSAFQFITAEGQRTEIIVHPPSDNATIKQKLRSGNCFCHSTILMRTEALRRVGGYRVACTEAQDYDLWMRFGDQHEFASIPTVLQLYRIHPNQVSLTRVERQAVIALAVRAATRIRRRTGIDPLPETGIIDIAALRHLGVTEEEIDGQLVGAYLNCLSIMPKLGLGKAVLEALREIVTHRSLAASLAKTKGPGVVAETSAAVDATSSI